MIPADEAAFPYSSIKAMIDRVKAEHPFQVHGDYDTYCDYNQGWQDALDRLDSLLPTIE